MKTKSKVMLLICLVAVILMHGSSVSHAALQANGKSTKKDTIGNWLLNVRKMEATGGTLGLEDTINTSNLTSSASESNNLDIHMELNTEYGAMAILSASSYGNPNKIENGGTTTGNKTGIYIYLNNEWVSAGCKELEVKQFRSANAKYKNIYTTTYVAKRGDAIEETKGWHGSTKKSWLTNDYFSGLSRANSGSLFSYSGDSGTYLEAAYTTSGASRAVVVVGNGL